MADSEIDISFSQLGIGSVLKQNQLIVPPNQREYSWTVRETRTLFQDFAKAIADGERSYFLGTIVTIPKKGGVLEVSDGQQRLATTAILLSAIERYLKTREPIVAESINNEFLTGIDRASRERVPKLRLNVDDNDYFRARLTGQESVAATKPSHKLIDAAVTEAESQVEKIVSGHAEKDHGDILNQWIDFLQYKAIVVLLIVQNEANAYRMFETLNDRGLRTSQADLVKNYLFGRAGERLPEVQQTWALMRGALETVEEEDITIIFLRHALISTAGSLRRSRAGRIFMSWTFLNWPASRLLSEGKACVRCSCGGSASISIRGTRSRAIDRRGRSCLKPCDPVPEQIVTRLAILLAGNPSAHTEF